LHLQYLLFLLLTYSHDFLAVLQRAADFLLHVTLLGIYILNKEKKPTVSL
jgi:hypothetical protein